MFPAFVTAQNFDFDAQKTNRNLHFRFRQMRHAHSVFLRRNDHCQIAAKAATYECRELRFVIVVMVDVAFCKVDVGAKFVQCAFEAFGGGDAANGANERVAQTLERQPFASENILKIERFMCTLDNLGGAIVKPDTFDELPIRRPGTFSDKDIAGAPKISRGLAQHAAREQEFIAKWRLPIHEHDIQPMFEMEILQAAG